MTSSLVQKANKSGHFGAKQEAKRRGGDLLTGHSKYHSSNIFFISQTIIHSLL